MAQILLSIPFPLSWRNLMPTGMAAQLLDGGKHFVVVASPYEQADFADTFGNPFQNFTIRAACPTRPARQIPAGPKRVSPVESLRRIA